MAIVEPLSYVVPMFIVTPVGDVTDGVGVNVGVNVGVIVLVIDGVGLGSTQSPIYVIVPPVLITEYTWVVPVSNIYVLILRGVTPPWDTQLSLYTLIPFNNPLLLLLYIVKILEDEHTSW